MATAKQEGKGNNGDRAPTHTAHYNNNHTIHTNNKMVVRQAAVEDTMVEVAATEDVGEEKKAPTATS